MSFRKMCLFLFSILVPSTSQSAPGQNGLVVELSAISKLEIPTLDLKKSDGTTIALLTQNRKTERLKIYKDLASYVIPSSQIVVRVYIVEETIVGVAFNNSYREGSDRKVINFSSEWLRSKK